MQPLDDYANYKEAPAPYWIAQRELPWLPGSRERLIFFYVTLDDAVALPSDVQFYRAPPQDPSRAEPTWTTGSHSHNAPVSLFGFAYRFLKGERSDFEVKNFAATAEAVSTAWVPTNADRRNRLAKWIGQRWRAIKHSRLGSGALRPFTVIEICFRDPGGLCADQFKNSDGIVLDYLSLGLIWLKEIVEGYRIAAYVPIRAASYMNLGPFVVTVEIDVQARLRTPKVVFPLESAKRTWATTTPRVSGGELLDSTLMWASRIAAGDPLATYGINMWTARRMCFVETYYEAAIVHCTIAIESLLSAVWLLLQWERGSDSAVCITKLNGAALGRPFFDTVFGWLGSDLGGAWDPVNAAEVADWNINVRNVRNLVAHTGKQVSRLDAEKALESSRLLNQMVTHRLLAKIKKYPRATYLVASADGIDDFFKPGTWDRRFCSLREEPYWVPQFAGWVDSGRDGMPAVSSFSGAIDVCKPGCTTHRQP